MTSVGQRGDVRAALAMPGFVERISHGKGLEGLNTIGAGVELGTFATRQDRPTVFDAPLAYADQFIG